MQYVAHETEMDTPDKDGVPARAHWELLASRGRVDAIERVRGYEMPLEMGYIYAAAGAMFGRSGVGMSGVAPLSYSTVRDWMSLTGTRLAPHEVEAVIALDGVMRTPVAVEKEEAPAGVVSPSWPTRAPGVVPVFVKEDEVYA